MFRRFLLFASALLLVLSSSPSHALAKRDHSHGPDAGTPAAVAGGNQEQ